jgi:hypothetical protein
MPVTITKDTSTRHTHYKLPGSVGEFSMPAIPESEAHTLPVLKFNAAVKALGDYADKASAIVGDRELSDLGRTKRLEPLQTQLVLQMAGADAQLDREVAHFDKRESDLLAVPKLDPTHAAVAVEDRELRGWWRQQSAEERSAHLQRIASEPGHERLMIAMMRSPVPQLDHEVKFIADVWKSVKRLDNPGEALAIDQGRSNLEWARRGVAQVAGLTRMALQWDDKRVVRTVLNSADPDHHGAFKVFGIDAMAAEAAKRSIESESRIAQLGGQ